MSVADLSILIFQMALPIGMLVWLGFRPAQSALLSWLQISTVALYLLALCLVPIWLFPPWWTPYVYLAVAIAITARQLVTGKISARPRLPSAHFARTAAILLAVCSIILAAVNVRAIAGRVMPDEVLDLAYPLGPGTYLVASCGSTQIVKGHMLTLNPKTDRQRAYRGQSFALDLIKIDGSGLRAPGWRPRDPTVYEIFGEPIYAPCAGKVLSALQLKPDMPVPQSDTSLLEGNHVFIDCGGFGVLLAHLRQGSVRVAVGDSVDTGDMLGEVRNSGQTGEPHLHIHAQRLPSAGPLLSREPLFITLNERFLARNQRVKIAERPSGNREQ